MEADCRSRSATAALYRLELSGALAATRGISESSRKAKYYEMTAKGRRIIAEQQAILEWVSNAVDRLLAQAPKKYEGTSLSRVVRHKTGEVGGKGNGEEKRAEA